MSKLVSVLVAGLLVQLGTVSGTDLGLGESIDNSADLLINDILCPSQFVEGDEIYVCPDGTVSISHPVIIDSLTDWVRIERDVVVLHRGENFLLLKSLTSDEVAIIGFEHRSQGGA